MTDAGIPDAVPAKRVERYVYDPYGRTYIERWNSGGGGSWERVTASRYGNPFGWTGQRYDAGVGLYAFLLRTYSPELGRWLQRDPIGLAGGLNVYLYCGANPLTNVDPDGLWSLWRWAYTGDGNAEDEVYGAAVNAAGQWLYESSWLRGVYVGVGTKRNRGVNVSAGVSWTIDSGFNVYVCVSAGWSERVRGLRNGRFSSRTSGIGYVGSWGEGGWGGGFILGGGQNQKARGGFAGAGGDGTISIGGSRGVLQGGFILDPGRIVR